MTMTKSLKSTILSSILLAACATTAQAASEFQYYVYPVGSITGISQSALGVVGAEAKYGGMIDEKYAEIFFDAPTQQKLIKNFKEEVEKKFPTAIVGGNQIRASKQGKYAYQPYEKSECRPDFTVNYKDSFAIAMGLSRLSVYFNSYSDFTQVLIPVTYTVRFVKLNGASVVFSKSETIYTGITSTTASLFKPGTKEIKPEYIAKIKEALLADGLKMVERHVSSAATGFTPKQSEIAIVARDGDYFIFGGGSEAGFTSGEDFDAVNEKGEEFSFTVQYASNGVAVAVASDFSPEIKKATNGLRAGNKLTFSFSKQGKDDAKPSVMAIQYKPPVGGKLSDKQVTDNALLSIVADDIGFKAPFNLIKHDADFSRLKNQIRGEANCDSSIYQTMNGFSDNSTKPRNNPDYYLKLDTFSSPVFTATGVGGVSTKSIFSNTVSLSLIDRSSLVNQVFIGNHGYELERTAGKGLDVNQANEINLKNAALVSMEDMLKGFAVNNKTIQIKSTNPGAIILAEPLSVAVFNQAKIVRPVSIGRSGKPPLLMPLAQNIGQLIKPNEETNKIQIKGEIKTSDLIMLGSSDPKNKPLRFCDDSRKRHFLMTPSLTSPGLIEGAVGRQVAFKAKGFNLIETDPAYLASVESALREGFFGSQEVLKNIETPYCVVVQEVQQLVKNDCSNNKCSGTSSVASGVRIFEGANKIGESLSGAKFDYTEIEQDQLSQFVGIKAYEQHLNSLSVHKSKLH
jgi:hypothetical protein